MSVFGWYVKISLSKEKHIRKSIRLFKKTGAKVAKIKITRKGVRVKLIEGQAKEFSF